MHEARRVRGGEAAPRLREDFEDLGARRGAATSQSLERAALDVLHRDEDPVALDADVVHADDVGVRQARHRLAFASQPLLAGTTRDRRCRGAAP